jgi:hypothetical protein
MHILCQLPEYGIKMPEHRPDPADRKKIRKQARRIARENGN